MFWVKEFEEAKVVVDNRYAPLLITTFWGSSNYEAAKWHMEHHYAAILDSGRRGGNVIVINDSSRSSRPQPQARKYWADSLEATPPGVESATLATFVVVSSPIIRGALTAVSWMTPKARRLELFPSLEAALAEALKRYEERGIESPLRDPAAYRLPEA